MNTVPVPREFWQDFNDVPLETPPDTVPVTDTPAPAPDRDAIAAFLGVVAGYCEGWIALRGFVDLGQGFNGRPHTVWIEADQAAADKTLTFVRWAAREGAAAYLIPGTVRDSGCGKAADVIQMQTVVVDLDTGDVEAKSAHLVHHLGCPTLVVESGGVTDAGQNKLHLWWQLTEPVTDSDIALVCRLRLAIAQKAGGDVHFQSAHQPIRIPGSVYHKGGRQRLVTIRAQNAVEYDLRDLADAVDAMPAFPGVADPADIVRTNTGSAAHPDVQSVLTTPVRAEGADAWTRFAGASAAIGHYVRLAFEGRMGRDDAWEAICQYNAAMLRPSWPLSRLASEAQRLWERHCDRYGDPTPALPPAIRLYSLGELLDDTDPMPEDLIAPRVMTPGGMMVTGGAPKVGKSDFLIHLLVHAAGGRTFLGLKPARPLRIVYLQTEIQYAYLRERLQQMSADSAALDRARQNLFITPRLTLMLNEQGVDRTVASIQAAFPTEPPDILCLDPIRNLFDGGPEGPNENSNAAMLFFLQERVEKLRERVNPNCGLILCHHTRKIGKKQLAEDPFQALSGAGSLRGYYTTGLLLHRPDEDRTERLLEFELRNGPSLPTKLVDKQNGRWVEIDRHSSRLVRQTYGAKLDAERRRKHDRILQLLFDQALEGRVYTVTQFAEQFENKAGLGSKDGITERISVLATKGYIKFCRNTKAYGLPPAHRSKFGYMCVQDMRLGGSVERIDPITGEVTEEVNIIMPTHYKCPQSGAMLPIEDPGTWIYHDGMDAIGDHP